ncbi:MAG TPA: gamma carbonic anhydrase family protein [Thermoplasmata archaeon]|nr:gamma carbonic anhydrase family protein [Thermoplasmata archaeon]
MIYIAPTAVLAGDVAIADFASVWHGAVLRGDFDAVAIGRDSNVQDNAVVHVDYGMPARIGERVTVGHAAVVHGCVVEDDTLIGMNATVNSGAVIRQGSVVASGAVARENAEFPQGSLIAGVPAKVVRPVDEALRTRIELSWKIYRELAQRSLPSRPVVRPDPAKRVGIEMSRQFTELVRRD